MDRTELMTRQNRRVVQLLWIASVLAFLNNLVTVRDPLAGFIIVFACGGLALLMSYVVYTNRMIFSAKYLALVGVFLTVFVFIQFTPGLLSYLTIYIGLLILAIYHDGRLMAAAGGLGVVISTYAYFAHRTMIFHERYYNLWSMVALNFFIVLACCLLVLQAQYGYRQEQDAEPGEQQ